MNQNRKLAQLMFKDNFMFGAVMVNEEICRDFLEMAVGFPIEKVEISREKSMIYHPEYRGIRLDIIAKSLFWRKGPDTITARWTWSCCLQGRIMNGFPQLM